MKKRGEGKSLSEKEIKSEIRKAKQSGNQKRLYDGNGLSLFINSKGKAFWHIKIKKDNKDTSRSIGEYPFLSIKQAREKRDELFSEIKNNPHLLSKNKITFDLLFNKWIENYYTENQEETKKKTSGVYNNYIFQVFGNTSIADIETQSIYNFLDSIYNTKKYEPVKRSKSIFKNSFSFALNSGLINKIPLLNFDNMFPAPTTKHRPAITTEPELKELLKKIFYYSSNYKSIETAVKILPFLFCRPSELIKMKWEDIIEVKINNEKILFWNYISTKTKIEMLTYLPSTVLSLLDTLKNSPFYNKNSIYVFNQRISKTGYIYKSSLNNALQSLGVDTQNIHTSHGWRATARTILVENFNINSDIIETQLSHTKRNPLRATYDRTKYINQRIAMMKTWEEYLLKLIFS